MTIGYLRTLALVVKHPELTVKDVMACLAYDRATAATRLHYLLRYKLITAKKYGRGETRLSRYCPTDLGYTLIKELRDAIIEVDQG
ncbi:MAG: hypothetical protein KTR20_14105 [Cellvibrionaceae bacterium]|nr:hypothetical protein [Cellvibrionaceae bacterium]